MTNHDDDKDTLVHHIKYNLSLSISWSYRRRNYSLDIVIADPLVTAIGVRYASLLVELDCPLFLGLKRADLVVSEHTVLASVRTGGAGSACWGTDSSGVGACEGE